MNEEPDAPEPRIIRTRRNGFDVYTRETSDTGHLFAVMDGYLAAGVDFEKIQEGGRLGRSFAIDCGGELLRLTALQWVNPGRLVFRAEYGGRTYVLKWSSRKTVGLKWLAPWAVGLTYYTRLFRMVSRAAARGCTATQNYWLTAERPRSAFRMDVLVLLEYVEGKPLIFFRDNIAPLRPALTEAVCSLAEHGLSLDDLSPGNFLVSDSGKITVIDLSCRFPARLNTVKMIMKMNRRYGLDIPIQGFAGRLLEVFLSIRYTVRGWLGKDDF